jgi:hypothetical protein
LVWLLATGRSIQRYAPPGCRYHPAFKAPSFAEFYSSEEVLAFTKSWTGLEKEQLHFYPPHIFCNPNRHIQDRPWTPGGGGWVSLIRQQLILAQRTCSLTLCGCGILALLTNPQHRDGRWWGGDDMNMMFNRCMALLYPLPSPAQTEHTRPGTLFIGQSVDAAQGHAVVLRARVFVCCQASGRARCRLQSGGGEAALGGVDAGSRHTHC